MKRLTLVLAFWGALVSAALAQGGMGPGPGTVHSTGGGGCSQATAFLARVSNHTNDTNYTTMICGLVTDGVYAKLDLLYIFAANNSTDALLNIIASTTTTLSATAPTFTANTGFAGNGTSASINVTGYTLGSGTNFTQNSASMFGWSTEAGADNGVIVGNSISFNSQIFLQSFNFGSASSTSIGAANLNSGTLSTGLGLFTTSRTSSTELDTYQNATNIATSAANASQAITAANPWFLALNGEWFGGGIAAGGFGGGLTSTDVTNLQSRIHTFLNAVNPTTFP